MKQVNNIYNKKIDPLIVDTKIVSYFDDTSKIPEDFRTLRTNLKTYFIKKQLVDVDNSSSDGGPKIITVTSSCIEEGKTITAANLAAILAKDANTNVLLINADLRDKSSLQYFHGDLSLGLTDLLSRDDIDISDVILPTQMEQLFFMPSGKEVDDASELLGSLKMNQLIDYLRESQFSYIIIDVPSVLSYTDAAIVSSLGDGTLFVVRTNKTPHSLLKKAITQLDHAHVKVLGFVMTYADQFA